MSGYRRRLSRNHPVIPGLNDCHNVEEFVAQPMARVLSLCKLKSQRK